MHTDSVPAVRARDVKGKILAIKAPDLGHTQGGVDPQAVERAVGDINLQAQIGRGVAAQVKLVLAADQRLTGDPLALIRLQAPLPRDDKAGRCFQRHPLLQIKNRKMGAAPYQITITEDADRQFRCLPVRHQRILEAAILSRLQHQSTTPTKAIKRLRPNPLAEFELRAGDLRALYNVEGDEVVVLVVGRKVGNTLIAEGEEFHGHQDHPTEPSGN
ncbi:MAG TPA: hypothetical protein VG013_09165 [Gemmataceae bacterium]|nr:hypothetical protein [Gemmataceae bacterium]